MRGVWCAGCHCSQDKQAKQERKKKCQTVSNKGVTEVLDAETMAEGSIRAPMRTLWSHIAWRDSLISHVLHPDPVALYRSLTMRVPLHPLVGLLAVTAPTAYALEKRCEPGETCQTIIPTVVTQT